MLDEPKISHVFLRTFWGINPSIVEMEKALFTGLTLNPGLRRIKDYRLTKSYSDYTKLESYGTGAGNKEFCLSKFFGKNGFRGYTLGK